VQHHPIFCCALFVRRSKGDADAPVAFLSVVSYLGYDIPERASKPTEARPGRPRNRRAEQVSIDRRTVTQLFEVIARIVGHQAHTEPKRELILKEGWCSWSSPSEFPLGYSNLGPSPSIAVVKVIEEMKSGTPPPYPMEGVDY
jgi:hypothetical protein